MIPAGHASESLPSASVVIPTFNRGNRIEPVVRAALADEATREVIVVVDGSRDGTYERLVAIARDEPRLRPIWQDNAGQLAALQRGIELARCAVVVLLDDDVVASPELITGHVRHHALKGHQVVVGYMPVAPPSTWRERITACLYSLSYEDGCRVYESEPDRILNALWAGNLSSRRADALEVRFDQNRAVPSGYLCDREVGLRLMNAGFIGVFDRSLRASHLYVRSLEGRRRDAVTAGRDKCRLHEVYRDLLGSVVPDPWERRARARRLVVNLGISRAGAGVRAVLFAMAYSLGRVGRTRIAARYFGLLCQVEERQAYIAECHRRNATLAAVPAVSQEPG